MNTATPLMTNILDDVTQTTYELSEPVPYTRWNGVERMTWHVIVSHTQLLGANETAVFPGNEEGKIISYGDPYILFPMCDDETALTAIGLTPTPPTP